MKKPNIHPNLIIILCFVFSSLFRPTLLKGQNSILSISELQLEDDDEVVAFVDIFGAGGFKQALSGDVDSGPLSGEIGFSITNTKFNTLSLSFQINSDDEIQATSTEFGSSILVQGNGNNSFNLAYYRYSAENLLGLNNDDHTWGYGFSLNLTPSKWEIDSLGTQISEDVTVGSLKVYISNLV